MDDIGALLTDKQRIFVEEYLVCWNATEAARKAGYPETSARQIGSENLSKPDIAELIKQRMSEKAMNADEVLARLADHARGDFDHFFDVGPRGAVRLNLAKAKKAGKLHLVKSYSKGRGGVVRVDLYDAQAALVHIGKHLKLFTDGASVVVNNILDLEEWKRKRQERLENVVDMESD